MLRFWKRLAFIGVIRSPYFAPLLIRISPAAKRYRSVTGLTVSSQASQPGRSGVPDCQGSFPQLLDPIFHPLRVQPAIAKILTRCVNETRNDQAPKI
jgi:hypothetical protein